MRCVGSCGSTSFPWLVFFFGALQWGSMIHKHTGRCMLTLIFLYAYTNTIPLKLGASWTSSQRREHLKVLGAVHFGPGIWERSADKNPTRPKPTEYNPPLKFSIRTEMHQLCCLCIFAYFSFVFKERAPNGSIRSCRVHFWSMDTQDYATQLIRQTNNQPSLPSQRTAQKVWEMMATLLFRATVKKL